MLKDYALTDAERMGPKDDYDDSNWALTLSSVAKESCQGRNDNPPSPTTTKPPLTWWHDPSNPAERTAKDDIPIGLRPPEFEYAYVPAILQSLFHITLFRHYILTHQPLPYGWGSVDDYWKGKGDGIYGYTLVRRPPLPAAEAPLDADESIPIEERVLAQAEWDAYGNTHLEAMTVPDKALSELQKLYAFLSHTRRQYGSSIHFVRSMSDKKSSRNDWRSADVGVDVFLDSLFNVFSTQRNLVDLFRLRAQIEYGDDVDHEEIFYLTLGSHRKQKSFHECLAPLVYESDHHQNNDEDDDDEVGNLSDTSSDSAHIKITTFEHVPPILLISFDGNGDEGSRVISAEERYMVEKTLYMDRYLLQNRDKALAGYQQVEDWRNEIRRARSELKNTMHSCRSISIDKRSILKSTLDYFATKQDDPDGEINNLRTVLMETQENITRRLEELEHLERDRMGAIHKIFDVPELHKKPYDLHASLHRDGYDGPGHYWAYANVEGDWYKFSDALVEPVLEQHVLYDPTPPFALIYTDRSIQKIPKEQLDADLPATLQEFVESERSQFERELHEYGQRDSEWPVEGHLVDVDDDVNDGDVDTADNQSINYADSSEGDAQSLPDDVWRDTTDVSPAVDETVTRLLLDAESYSADDGRIIRDIKGFLAYLKDTRALKRLFTLYTLDDKETINDELAKEDELLAPYYFEYETYQGLAETSHRGLTRFVAHDYQGALACFDRVQEREDAWRFHINFEVGPPLAFKRRELCMLSFYYALKPVTRACISEMDKKAYQMACDDAYRTRGLEEALRTAERAQRVVGQENISSDPLTSEMRDRWLRFSEERGADLQDGQSDSLNTLVMLLLEGSTTKDTPFDTPDSQAYPTRDETEPEILWRAYEEAKQHAFSVL
ncbi:hypothetical protein BCR43DRAFT_483570 [Syncephalastrum racemosum]|uniref:USP domain-containing protein n=1 Tax=Syncephalastrum racemosum TaxID=13706 RepID=A0A1X2HWV0_SYNRA|nr:hypothetical protein BCR43DRAFT_483570 [Syncephalastrum racemosum]